MHIIFAVTNDISTDQRVIRAAYTMQKINAHVTVIGRHSSKNPVKTNFRFKALRMKLLFHSGPLFYAEYNIRLLLKLLFMRSDVLVSNDLDTLPAVYLAAKLRKKTLIYDSHEYFTEVPELTDRRFTRGIWEKIELLILPRLQFASTVSAPIAQAYGQKYHIPMEVIRNLPFRKDAGKKPSFQLRRGSEKIILYQGSLNRGRGLETAIEAMANTNNMRLVIIGKGDVEEALKKLVLSLGLSDRVTFTGSIDPDELFDYTVQADLGISLEEDLGLNYRYALPNKVFDYIQAGVPVLVSDLPEVKDLVRQYGVGMVNNAATPGELGQLFTRILADEETIRSWKSRLEIAARELCWENEENKLIALCKRAIENS
jgi:glycosyltransferase involved in cell wall biosynthesis